jgi:ATP-dependent Lon protease
VVTPKNIFNAAKEFCKVIDLKDVGPYMTDPDSPEGKAMAQASSQKPDPVMAGLQMKAALDEKADQRKAQIETVQAQADIQTQRDRTRAEMAQTERDFELKRELALLEAEIEREKCSREEARKDREHEQRMAHARQMHDHAMAQGHFNLAAGAQAHQTKMERSGTTPNGTDQ